MFEAIGRSLLFLSGRVFQYSSHRLSPLCMRFGCLWQRWPSERNMVGFSDIEVAFLPFSQVYVLQVCVVQPLLLVWVNH